MLRAWSLELDFIREYYAEYKDAVELMEMINSHESHFVSWLWYGVSALSQQRCKRYNKLL